MDEPTGWLAGADVVRLHDTIRMLKARGVGIVYISHVLDEIFAVCDTVTIMRDGRVVAESAVAEIDRPRLVHLMVGEKLARESADAALHQRRPRGTGAVRLSARGLGKDGVFADVSFDLHAGEIFCLTGLIGSRRTELVRTLFGSDRFDSGTLEIDGRAAAPRTPLDGMSLGIGFVPEDRHREGLMLDMNVTENLAMATLERHCRGPFLSRSGMVRTGRKAIDDLSVQPRDGSKVVRLLSGGNQQKVVLAKLLATEAKILLFFDPTRGVDVGTKGEIFQLMRDLAAKGYSILFYSSDLPELVHVADRVAVLRNGSIAAVLEGGAISEENILKAAMVEGGVH